ncbi:MAG: hypothetical protein ACXWJB_01450 [Limisphaerales bacterium]
MDVHCSTCNEPWDVYHLWHDAIFDTGLRPDEAESWCKLPHAEKLSPRYRDEFKAVGWEFGCGVINVIHCPACPKDAKPNAERIATKAALEDLLGDDEDGLAATFEDYKL